MNADFNQEWIINVPLRVGGHKLQFDCFTGDFQTRVLSNGQIWERHIVEFILANVTPNRPFFDIGANIGFHSVMCQKIAKQKPTVVSVEPHPTIIQVLKKNRSQNNCDFHIVEAACWDSTGYVEMTSELGSDTGDTFVTSGDVKVPTVLIDDLADRFGHPKIIKMDIQGFEAEGILGAAQTIERGNMDVIVEFDPKISKRSSKNLMESFKLFEKNNYTPFFFRAHPAYAAELINYDILRSLNTLWLQREVSGMDLVFRQKK
jgi:FkbM family methyltransferase